MNVLIALLFVANAGGVLAFAGINAILAVLVGLDLSWARWPALILPAVGGLGLTANTILPRKGTPIDFTILGLDISTVVLVIFGLIA